MKFKKAYFRDRINSKLINLIFKFCKFKNDGKIIVKSMDGIGDILIRSKLVELILDKYGKENVVFLMKAPYKQLGEMLGYQVYGVPRKDEKKIFRRLKMMYEINKEYSPRKFINIEFGNDSTVANISAPEKIGVYDSSDMVNCYNKYYTKSFKLEEEKILDKVRKIGEKVLDTKLDLKDIIPDLRRKFNYKSEEKGIVVAVGSTDRSRVCSPLRLKDYILEVIKFFPDEKVILVGNGELQKKYADELIKNLNGIEILDLVGKTDLRKVFEIVNNSKIFIGFESGLYNLCFATRTKAIALFKNINVPFAHDVPWIKVIGLEKELIDDFNDLVYTNKEINNISVERFRKAIEELR